jgi:hypothetical protein
LHHTILQSAQFVCLACACLELADTAITLNVPTRRYPYYSAYIEAALVSHSAANPYRVRICLALRLGYNWYSAVIFIPMTVLKISDRI